MPCRIYVHRLYRHTFTVLNFVDNVTTTKDSDADKTTTVTTTTIAATAATDGTKTTPGNYLVYSLFALYVLGTTTLRITCIKIKVAN